MPVGHFAVGVVVADGVDGDLVAEQAENAICVDVGFLVAIRANDHSDGLLDMGLDCFWGPLVDGPEGLGFPEGGQDGAFGCSGGFHGEVFFVGRPTGRPLRFVLQPFGRGLSIGSESYWEFQIWCF